MIRLCCAATVMLLATACAVKPLTPYPADAVLYTGAMVWDGDAFAPRDFAVSGSRFIDASLHTGPVEVVNLQGRYVIPPLANAHHHITNPSDASSVAFLREGVFYAWNPNNLASLVDDEARAFFARADTYDVRQALGGITEPGGHPEKLYVVNLAQWVYRGKEKPFFDNNAYHYGRDQQEIVAALDRLSDQGADFVKIYLLHSEDYQLRRDDEEYYGNKGLNPDNVAFLVREAHRRGLPVAAHVETTHDFRVAVAAGVDMLAHLPAYSSEKSVVAYGAKRLTRADAAAAAAAGTMVVPTYALARSRYERLAADGKPVDAALVAAHYETQAHNLRLLIDSGVPVLTGTDADIGIVKELIHAVSIDAMTPGQALQSALTTAQYLFPDRMIGRIAAGYEADFLVLDGDPLNDLNALTSIRMRYKNGQPIVLDAEGTP